MSAIEEPFWFQVDTQVSTLSYPSPPADCLETYGNLRVMTSL